MSQKDEPLTALTISKSNKMINSKYGLSMIEQQVIDLAIRKIRVNNYGPDDPLEVKLYPGEFEMYGISDKAHIYRDLRKVAKTIIGHSMFIEDGDKHFKAFAIVPNAEYNNGEFTLTFNNEIRSNIKDLHDNFTKLRLSILTSFDKSSSYRIYELLKQQIYKDKRYDNIGRVDVEYNISELKFTIGLANLDDPKVKIEMAKMGKNIDWDLLYNRLDKNQKKYEAWGDFNRYILIPAQEELALKSDVRFEYETVKIKKKTTNIIFHIYQNIPKEINIRFKKSEDDNKMRQLEFPKDIDEYAPLFDEYVGHNNLVEDDIKLLLIKANYDVKKIRDAIKLADKQKNINSYIGWLVKCVENDYKETKVSRGSAERAKKEDVVYENYQNTTVEEKKDIDKALLIKTKQKEEYPDFIEYIKENGVEEEQLEILYTPGEIVNMFVDWKVGRKINF